MPKEKNISQKGYKNPANEKDHWEMDVSRSVFPKYSDTPTGAFLAANGSKRPQPHIKINECDH